MAGNRSGVDALDRVVVTVEANTTVTTPQESDHLNRFAEGGECFTRRASRPAHAFDRIPEGPGAESELKSSPADDVDRSSLLGQGRRVSKGKTCHVVKHS